MSRVFVAVERALDREVVIKVLAPELAATVSADRFSREIRLAAQLQQANIVPLLFAGETRTEGGGQAEFPFYAMPLVAGDSLRHLLATGNVIPEGTVVHVLRDVARALAYAHEHGVIHRDIKPENVLLSGGTAVVTDFGIAKALAASRTHAEHPTLTGVGGIVGTPQYMAPEQLMGEANMDQRVDIYAFGCLGYELLTGRAPFQGLTASRLFAAHLNEKPAPPESLRHDVSSSLAALLMRCLAKDAADRPRDANEILEALDQVATPRTGPANRVARHGASVRRWTMLGVVALIAIGGGAWALARARRGAAGPLQIAVLPFVNVGGDPTQEYFADGMSVALTTALSRIPGLQLTARSLAFTYKGKDADVRRVGTELGVSAVLEGTVQRVGNRLRVTGQLINSGDGKVRWTNTYERNVDDVFAVQDSITVAIVTELRGKLTAGAIQRDGQRSATGTTNLEAYDKYMRGVYLLDRRGSGVAQAVGLFNEAIALDSGLASAYGKLSEALELLPYFTETPAASVEQRVIAAARRALAIDSTIAEAHVGLALMYGHAYRFRDADAQFRLALADDPLSPEVRTQYGRQLMQEGHFRDAIVQLREATRLDPLSATAFVWLAHNYALSGQLDSAAVIARRAHGVDPSLILGHLFGALDLAWAGDTAGARTLITGFDASAPWMGQAAFAYAAIGDAAAARRILLNLERLPASTWMIHTALSYASLATKDTTRALDELEAARRAQEITPKWVAMQDRVFDPIRRRPRFAAVTRAFGLDDPAR